MNSLTGKVAIVTGASSGIGEATACLTSDEASFITGTTLTADGGFHLTL